MDPAPRSVNIVLHAPKMFPENPNIFTWKDVNFATGSFEVRLLRFPSID